MTQAIEQHRTPEVADPIRRFAVPLLQGVVETLQTALERLTRGKQNQLDREHLSDHDRQPSGQGEFRPVGKRRISNPDDYWDAVYKGFYDELPLVSSLPDESREGVDLIETEG